MTAYEGEYEITLVLQNSADVNVGTIQFDLPVAVSRVEAIKSTQENQMANKNIALTEDKRAIIVNIEAKSIVSIKISK